MLQLFILEIFCTVVFTVEFFIRLIVANKFCPSCGSEKVHASLESRSHERTLGSQKKSSKVNEDDEGPFFTQLYSYLDFIAILPFYIEVAFSMSASDGSKTGSTSNPFLVILDIFKLFRVFRIFKLIRFFPKSMILLLTLKRSVGPIWLSVKLLLLIFFVGGGLVLIFEPCNGEPFTSDCEFPDIVQSGYYTWITILTVGYGDQVPQSFLGRIGGVFLMISGSIFLAMPLAILGTKFEKEYTDYEKREEKKKKQKDGDFQVDVPAQDVSMAVRKLRLLSNGMKALDQILQAEEYLHQENKYAALHDDQVCDQT